MRNILYKKIIFTKRKTSTENADGFIFSYRPDVDTSSNWLVNYFGNITVGTITSVGQISGNIFNSLSTINQLQVTIKSVDPILKKFHDFPEGPKTCIATIQDVRFDNVSYHFGEKVILRDSPKPLKKEASMLLLDAQVVGSQPCLIYS